MPLSSIRTKVRELLRGFGVEVSRTANPFLHLTRVFEIDLIIDVGANVGGFGTWARRCGYTGHIVSFEPIRELYADLARTAQHDKKWDTKNEALGDFDGEAFINRTFDSELSSLAEQTATAHRIFGDTDSMKLLRRESIIVRRLDSVFDEIRNGARTVLLKIDTQGFEKRVLDGAVASLPKIAGARIELSYDPMYENALRFDEMLAHMTALGYSLIYLEPFFFGPDPAQIVEADGTFFRLRPTSTAAVSELRERT